MPKLLAVRYRLLAGEEFAAVSAATGETHDFGGELALVFQDAPEVYVSWVSEPVQYCMGTKDRSHFLPGSLKDYDVSASGMWSGLVGRDVSLAYAGTDNQILSVSSAKEQVFLCSVENGHWWADEVTVCRQPPPADGA